MTHPYPEGPELTYGVTPRMDGTIEQKLAWRVLALREAVRDVANTKGGDPHQLIAENALAVDRMNAASEQHHDQR